MTKDLSQLGLAELFVLSACGKLPALESADDAGSVKAGGSLHDGANALDGPVKDGATFSQVEDSLVVKGLK
jgi:hypothetical protein